MHKLPAGWMWFRGQPWLAQEEAARRHAVVQYVGARCACGSTASAAVATASYTFGIGLIGGAAATPVAYQKHYDAIRGGWSRLGTSEKRRFLPAIAEMLTPDMKRELRDMLNEELCDA